MLRAGGRPQSSAAAVALHGPGTAHSCQSEPLRRGTVGRSQHDYAQGTRWRAAAAYRRPTGVSGHRAGGWGRCTVSQANSRGKWTFIEFSAICWRRRTVTAATTRWCCARPRRCPSTGAPVTVPSAREWIVSATAGRPRIEPKNGRPTCLVEERRAAQGSCGTASSPATRCATKEVGARAPKSRFCELSCSHLI